MPEQLWSISEMCREFAVTPRTLRFYEAKELIAPRRDRQKRLYTRRCRGRLKLILQGKRFGFSLEDIRQLLNLYDLGDQQATQIARSVELGRQRLQAMHAQRDELTSAIADLEDRLRWSEQVLAEQVLAGHDLPQPH